MPDYNLGRAHGEVVITADTRNATRGLGEYERAQKASSQAASDASRIESELTRRRNEAEQAIRRRKEAESEYTRIQKDSNSTTEQQIASELRRNQARDDSERATRRLTEAERAFQSAVRGNDDEVKKFLRTLGDFGDGVDRHNRKLKDFRSEITQTGLAFREVGSSLQGTVGIMSKVIGMLAAGGAAGGLLGLLGAGGIQGVIAATEAIKDFSGAILLMPAVVGGAAVVVGTLAVAFQGVGDALGAMDDPAKFTEAVRKLAPAAAQAVTIIASFRDAIKGAMAAVQQSLFQPIVDQIEPLIRTWLPALMQAGQQVANVLGQAGRVVAQWLQQPAQMQAFTTFINNLVTALNGLMPAIQPVLDAFTTLSVVGSQFLPQLAAIIVQIATAFNAWVQGAAQSGELQAWIQTAITSFEQLFRAIGNVLDAAQNIGRAFEAAGSRGFLQWLVDITQRFREWTESAQGTQILTTFFQNLQQASQLLGPILQTVGVAVLQLVNNLLQLGINMGPGIQTFFTALAGALNTLGQSLVASGPALGQILATLGSVLLGIVQQVGPQLPQIFQNLAIALANMAPSVVAVAGALAEMMSHLTPTEIEIILGIVVAFQGLSVVVPIIQAIGAAIMFLMSDPIILLVAAIAAAAVLIILNWDTIKAAAQSLWDKLGEFVSWLGSVFTSAWQSVASAVTDVWNSITNAFSSWLGQAYDWGHNLVTNIVRGIRDFIGEVAAAAGDVGQTIHDFLFTNSPAKKGPLSETAPEQMGESVARNFASGLSSTGVDAGAGDLAGGASGTTGTAFSSAGVGGRSGKGTSGFDQWIDNITQDLRSWSALAQGAFGLFKSVANIMVNTAKVTASLWNGGDNPMTQPGGVFGTAPGLTPEQQTIPGVANMPAVHGQAPIPELRPGAGLPAGAPPVPQQTIPGVPQAPGTTAPGPVGAPTVPAPPAAPPPAPPGPGSAGGPAPAPLPPAAPGTVGVPAGPSAVPNATAAATAGRVNVARGATPQKVAMGIVAEGRRRGLTDEQIQAAGMIASDETNFGTPGFNTSGGNASVGGVGGTYQQSSQAGWGSPEQILDPGYSISKFYDIYQENLRRFPNIDPINVAILTQNPQLVTQFGIAPGDLAGGSEYGRQNAAAWTGPRGGQATFNQGVQAAGPRAPGAAPPGVAPRTPGGGLPNVEGTRDVNNPSGIVLGVPLVDQGRGLPPPNTTQGGNRTSRRPPASVTGQAPPFQSVPYGLPAGTNTGGYGNPAANKIFPQWILDLGAQYGVKPSTYSGHQESDRGGEAGYAPNPQGLNRGIDWVGTPQQMEAFAQALLAYGVTEGVGGPLEQIIYQAQSGKQYGLGGAGADVSGRYYPQTGEGSYAEHATSPTGQGGHVHTRFSGSVPPTLAPGPLGAPPPAGTTPPQAPQAPPPPAPPPAPTVPGGTQPTDTAGDWMRVPAGWDIKQPIPMDVRRQHGIPDSVPPMFYSAQPGTVTNVATPAAPGTVTPEGSIVSPGQTISVPLPGGAAGQPGFPGTQQALPFGAKTPMDAFTKGMGAVSSIAGDAFTVFNDIITNIKAGADNLDLLVRGFANTEDVNKFIDNVQTFIKTGADIAKLVGDVGGMAGGASGGMDMGGGAALQAIAGIVSSALEATNMAIDLGQMAWQQFTKYAVGIFAGSMLGGPDTGPLSGNVRMLLNTNTGQVYGYSEDNPLNKQTHNMPAWLARSYGGPNPNAQPNTQQTQVNIYTGPGPDARNLISDTMWLVGTGSPSVASVAGAE
jgi:phage-related protein